MDSVPDSCFCTNPIQFIASPTESALRQQVYDETKQSVIQFITKVAACWTDDVIVSNVLDSLIWELNNEVEGDEK
jgi:hypothetical protein